MCEEPRLISAEKPLQAVHLCPHHTMWPRHFARRPSVFRGVHLPAAMMLLSSRLSFLALLRLGAASDTLGLSFFELGSVVANNLGGVPSPLAVPTANHRDSLPPPTTSATHSLAPATSCFFPSLARHGPDHERPGGDPVHEHHREPDGRCTLAPSIEPIIPCPQL